MSANNKQASNAPKLCKSGCGFFGSEATGGCCSKCWMESIKNKPTPAPTAVTTAATVVETADDTSEKTAPAQCTLVTTKKEVKEQSPELSAPVKKTKKKKKKAGYKNMMAAMMAGSDKKDEIAKEKELLQKGLGGGNFSKIEKI